MKNMFSEGYDLVPVNWADTERMARISMAEN